MEIKGVEKVMSEETLSGRIKRDAKQLHDELIRNNLRTDPQWWKVRFIDFVKKYHIKKAVLTKTPHGFWLEMDDGRVFDYLGLPDEGYFVKDLNSAYDPELMKNVLVDFMSAGILGDGEVRYEVKYGLDEE